MTITIGPKTAESNANAGPSPARLISPLPSLIWALPYRGRKRAFTDDQVDQLRQRAGAGETKTALARTFGVSRETVYQYLRTAP